MKVYFNKRGKSWAFLAVGLCMLLAFPLFGSEMAGEGRTRAAGESLDEKEQPSYVLEELTLKSERVEQVGDFTLLGLDLVDSAALQRQVQSTLGETLAWEPGLNASYYGPGSSRPVIRGLGDYRVRMLLDDIGTLDLSDSSPDHGVPLEPLLIREVNIHRGPDALLFGNAAVGGAINAKSRFLPETLPSKTLSGMVESRYNTVSNGRSAAAFTTVRSGDFAFRATGARRSADDYKINGQARTDVYEKNINFGSEPNPSGYLPNTHIDSESNSVGFIWEPQQGRARIGFAHSHFESAYGVPYVFKNDPAKTPGDSSLEMQQSRFDFEAAYQLNLDVVEKVSFRLGQADYTHDENFQGRSPFSHIAYTETHFDLETLEARADIYHRLFEGLEGVVGMHGFDRDLEAKRRPPWGVGAPVRYPYQTENTGVFLIEKWQAGSWTVQGGYRYEKQTIKDRSNAQFGVKEKSHSASLGLTWRDYERLGCDEIAVTLNLSRIERLPSETERYAFWENGAIGRFLVGADFTEPLTVERSQGLDLGMEIKEGAWSGRLNFFHYDFTDFIFLQDMKGYAQYVAKEAVFQGGEAELIWLLQKDELNVTRLKMMVDWVRGENRSDATNLPRIPPLRIGTRFERERGPFAFGLDLRYAFAQEKIQEGTDFVAPELETNGYLELNLDTSYAWTLPQGELTVFARASNLFDVERRSHASFLKDVAPLPGRSLSLGARWEF